MIKKLVAEIRELKEKVYRIKPNTESDGYGNFYEAQTWREVICL